MSPILIAADLLAIALLVFGMFLPRHGRRDLVAAYLGVEEEEVEDVLVEGGP